MSGRFWVGVIGISAWFGGGTVAAAAPPEAAALAKPAFTADPAELLIAARGAPAGDWPVVLLRDELDTRYDDQGRATVRWRWVFVVRTQAGIDDWGTLHAGFRPFHQDRPTLRARVIAPSGQVSELDTSLVTDAPVAGSANVLSDRRRIDAPLPRLQIGAVVEEEVVTRDREPILPVGGFAIAALGNDVPTATTLFTFSAPVARKARPVERKLPGGVRVRHEVREGRDIWSYALGALPALPELESAVPGEIVLAPYVGLSTAPSWAAVARAYRAVVERRIADGPLTLPPELPRTATLETIEAITRWLHRQVRYTGIELGDAALVPWPPAEVVKRGFGDCKDKATLLVALLRQAGLRADLALLSTGPGRDVDPDLPGVASFDHAIVRARVAGREVWIDATDELARPGQLPAADQGRRSLVIAEDTAGLAITPSARSSDNVVREVRTFVAAESGVARVTEVARATGVFEPLRRADYRGARADELQKTYREYVEGRYAGKLDRVSAGDPLDLAAPFEVRVEASDVHRVYTASEQIDVYLYPRSTFHELPWEIVSTEKQAETRSHEFAWQTPHVYEIEHRIEIPPGYTLPPAMAERTRPLGGTRVSFTDSRRIEGRTLVVTFRLDTGKPRLTAAELLAVRAAIAELKDEEVHVQIPHTAFALQREGKLREAIAEGRRMIALHPREALHHSQLATVLLAAGAGQAARSEARAAVALAPSDADALATLGWVLAFDTLGRAYTYDWDRAGALAALQKAHKLAPGHLGAAVALADVLQHDASGHNLDPGADLRGAAEAWRAAVAIEPDDERRIALARALLGSGQAAEAEAAARAATASDDRDKILVAAVAAGRGVTAAVQVAGELRVGAARGSLIGTAGWLLVLLQRYELARALFAEAGTSSEPAAQRAVVDRVTVHSPVPAGSADPESATRDVLLTTVDAMRRTPVFWDEAIERAFRTTATTPLPEVLSDGVAARFLADTLLSATKIQLSGGAGAWRATVEADGKAFRLYLVLDRGQVKLLGSSDFVDGIGRYALRARDATSQARARQLLDWVRGDLPGATGAIAPVLSDLWDSELPATPETIALAGAVLASQNSALSSGDAARLIEIAARCPAARPRAAGACRKLLARVYAAAGQWRAAAVQLDGIPAAAPADRALGMWRSCVLARASRCDDADRLAAEILDRAETHHDGLLARFMVGAICARPDAAQRGDALAADPTATAMDLNNVAWHRLVSGGDVDAARGLAQRATARDGNAPYPVNTLAAIEVEAGQLGAAVQSNLRALSLGHVAAPGPADWYVIGRIHDQLGLVDDARAAYQRIPSGDDDPLGSYVLAQKRLAALPRP